MAQRARRKNYRVRYDRIICVLAILIVLIFILTSCISSCANKKPGEGGSSVVDSMTSTGDSGTDSAGSSQNVQTPTEPPITYATTQVAAADVHKGNLILVNTSNPCAYNHTAIAEGTSTEMTFVTIQSILATKSAKHYTAKDWEVGLDQEAALAMDAWLEAFYTNSGNTDIRMISGYRTDSQDPEYHTGKTCTIGVYPEGSGSWVYKQEGNYAWVGEHAHEYGFILRYPESKESYFDENTTDRKSGTFRYVGVAAATYIAANDLCLEEYLEEVKAYSIDNMLKIETESASYGVYYVPMNANGNTSFSVPAGNTPYEISGNNKDGFIVTVTLSGGSAVSTPADTTEADTTEETTAAAE